MDQNVQISDNFTYGEFFHSDTANAKGIDNVALDEEIWYNIQYLVKTTLQPLRDMWGSALTINSGYRSPLLNKAVGGSPTSFHSFGMAADVDVTRGSNIDLFKMVFDYFPYTELILEEVIPDIPNSGWVHIAVAKGRELEHQLKYKLKGQPVKRASFEQIMEIIHA